MATLTIAAGARAIVILDIADFESAVFVGAGIRVVTPGALLDELLVTAPGIPAAAAGDLAGGGSGQRARPTRSWISSPGIRR